MDNKAPEAFRTISEVAEWLGTPTHVLRFWESRFPQVKPVKRAGGRRYYRPADMALLGGIKKLLHEDGMTIRGVQRILKTQGVRHVTALSPPLDEPAALPEEAAEVPVAAPAAKAEVPRGPKPLPKIDEAEPDLFSRLATGSPRPAAAPAAPKPEPKPEPAAAAPLDLTSIPDGPGDDDPHPAAPLAPFPLRDPRAARAGLARHPNEAAKLYARLLALSERMGAGAA
jgi:DNA-binding transcriptional MerR regulator